MRPVPKRQKKQWENEGRPGQSQKSAGGRGKPNEKENAGEEG